MMATPSLAAASSQGRNPYADLIHAAATRFLILLDLAEHRTGGFVPVQGRSPSPAGAVAEVSRAHPAARWPEHGLVEGTHGKGGGYRLTREPSDYSIGEIIRAADGSLSCLGTNVQLTRCEVSSGLSAVWNRLDKQIAACLDAIPLSTLATADAADEYVI